MTRGFGSDNHSGVHPELWQALAQANADHAPSYGTDDWSLKAEKSFKRHFGPNAQVFYVFNGTAANALAIKALCQSYQSVFCSCVSHLNVDECGAPEFFSGAKLIPTEHLHGKINIQHLEKLLIRRGDQHHSQPAVLSLTQPTELGTVYSREELMELGQWAKSHQLKVHMDGARLANAVLHLDSSFEEITQLAQVDVLSFGGTKNGFLFGEALVFLNPTLTEGFKYLRKQSGQLPSKTRFIAAAFHRYLEHSLWRDIASHQCEMAQRLHQGLRGLDKLEITQPQQSNAVFVKISPAVFKQLRQSGFFFYVWDETTYECRLMTSWDTTPEDVDLFCEKIRSLL